MSKKVLIKGNEAIVKGAIAAGCRAFFGYPITPQNEVPECMSVMMPQAGGVFVQAESEVASINMVYGAASAGVRTMTSSSSPGISLMQEGISYLAASELPCVIVNVQRGGPGLGNIAAGQADYFQMVKGGGHGDYKTITLAPWSVSECYTLTALAFDLADKYRNPAAVLADAIIGQMIESAEIPDDLKPDIPEKPWATNGRHGRGHKNIINSLWIQTDVLEALNRKLQAKYAIIRENEVRYHEMDTEDADLIIVAYGTSARISKTAIDRARAEGIKVGLFRPITLYPFPVKQISGLAAQGKKFLVVEMSCGQMVEDVRLAVNGQSSVDFYGRSGGVVPTPIELLEQVRKYACEEDRSEVAK